MNFFKSVLFVDEDDDDQQESSDHQIDHHPRSESESPTKSLDQPAEEGVEEGRDLDVEETESNQNPNFSIGSGWSFGGLIKTFASKSESVLETYRQDLEDFSSGLKKETASFREVATRVVKDLPVKFEVGTAVAQESLESVGQAIDDLGTTVWKGTAEIIAQGKDTLLSVDLDGDSSSDNQLNTTPLSTKRYSRFESQLYSIQSDFNTYCEDPDDLVDFSNWKLGFVLGEKVDEIENLLNENEVIERVYTKIVPSEVDDEMFWTRYFYRVYKLKQVEDARANLVKRVISGEDDEDLSWDIDDEEDEKKEEEEVKEKVKETNLEATANVAEIEEKSVDREIDNKGLTSEQTLSDNQSNEEVKGGLELEGKSEISGSNSDDLVAKFDETMKIQGKTDNGESGKDSDFSVVSSQQSSPDEEEEDLSWDEIEDIDNNNENKATVDERAGLVKRLNVTADDDEDLSWDIEEDDENSTGKS